MSEADEVFQNLGYIKAHDENFIYYNNLKNDSVIEFNLVKKVIRAYDWEDETLGYGIELEELQAIVKKAKELGWEV